MQNGLSSLDEERIMGVDAYKVHIVNIISIASVINWGTFTGLGDEDATMQQAPGKRLADFAGTENWHEGPSSQEFVETQKADSVSLPTF